MRTKRRISHTLKLSVPADSEREDFLLTKKSDGAWFSQLSSTITKANFTTFDFANVPVDPSWNFGNRREMRVHRIHAYPAKFPAFITEKALDYAKSENVSVHRMADIFCGCGTTAFESFKAGISFWGCDINPVATLIARTKSRRYQSYRISYYSQMIEAQFRSIMSVNEYEWAPNRLKYWYDESHYNDLFSLKSAIEKTIPRGAYRDFFLCAFSNILKPTSRWLTKSIKPQVDPKKKPPGVWDVFLAQTRLMLTANDEISEMVLPSNKRSSQIRIENGNFLDASMRPKGRKIDLIVTSPPYVTSYEYADLHQLSSLWLGYARNDDYRTLRSGSIGSRHRSDNNIDQDDNSGLNTTANTIVEQLKKCHVGQSKVRAVTRYFSDMQRVAKKTFSILSENGLALFVIGNTEYKSVRIENAKHLAESLLDAGYANITVSKREIKNKILTPYRDAVGKFTTDSSGRKVYSEEFIIIGRKKKQ